LPGEKARKYFCGNRGYCKACNCQGSEEHFLDSAFLELTKAYVLPDPKNANAEASIILPVSQTENEKVLFNGL
jgi:hypothetical protein